MDRAIKRLGCKGWGCGVVCGRARPVRLRRLARGGALGEVVDGDAEVRADLEQLGVEHRAGEEDEHHVLGH
eukprot:6197096-Pleurochrysis_carterae.AAC.1